MTRAEQLEKIKLSLNIKGNALDETLGVFLDDVKYYMADAGVSATLVDSEVSIGAICRGVADLYVNNEFSSYFYQRVSQLAIQADTPEPEPTDAKVTDVVFNLDGDGLIKSGYIGMSDGTKVDADLNSIPDLTVSCTDITSSDRYTTVTVTPELESGNHYIYTCQSDTIPALGEDMTGVGRWKDWDGVSTIMCNTSQVRIIECDANNIAVRAGIGKVTTVTS